MSPVAVVLLVVAAAIGFVIWIVLYTGSGKLVLHYEPPQRPVAALPPGEVHYHTHYEEHHHHHHDERQLHVHGQPPAVEAAAERKAIAPRHVVAGEIIRKEEAAR